MSSSRAGTPPFPDMSQLSGDLYRQWEKAMSTWWDQVVESPAFLGAMSKQVGAAAEARGRYEDAVDDTLERLHLPTRKDVVRLARVCTLLEERLLTQEDQILALSDKIDGLEREVVQARVEAAEARLESRERFDQLEAALSRLAASAKPDEPPRSPRKPRA